MSVPTRQKPFSSVARYNNLMGRGDPASRWPLDCSTSLRLMPSPLHFAVPQAEAHGAQLSFNGSLVLPLKSLAERKLTTSESVSDLNVIHVIMCTMMISDPSAKLSHELPVRGVEPGNGGSHVDSVYSLSALVSQTRLHDRL